MRHTRYAALVALLGILSSSASAQRRVEGNAVYSDSLPSIILQVDSSLTYLGTQRFVLYNVAQAEQHFFAELEGQRIKRYVWIQFEGYLPGTSHTYDYSRDSTIAMWDRTIYHNSSLRATPATEPRPDSDGARARRFLRERGLTFAPSMLYHRLVWLIDRPARNELMVIYMEDPASYGVPQAELEGDRLRHLLSASLERAGRSIQFRER